MLEMQVQILALWAEGKDVIRQRWEAARDDDRGEVTATTALIVLLVLAAIAAGGVIATKIGNNANNIPSP